MEYNRFLDIFKNGCIIVFCITGFIYFTIKISETKIDKTRYCPNCGYDIVYDIKK